MEAQSTVVFWLLQIYSFRGLDNMFKVSEPESNIQSFEALQSQWEIVLYANK